MPHIYRLRPSGEFLLDELDESYLWFSKPTEYKDSEDSNITSFVDNNDSISEAFEEIYKDSESIVNKSKHIGICCFTEQLPDFNIWRKFPSCKDGVCIEYDRELLKGYFEIKYGIGDCFKKIQYHINPTKFVSEKNHILWNIDADGNLMYRSIKDFEREERARDQLFLEMFTRISDRFIFQNESRIILGGYHITDYDDNVKGYKVPIPEESVLAIHLNPLTPENIKEELLMKYGEKVRLALL